MAGKLKVGDWVRHLTRVRRVGEILEIIDEDYAKVSWHRPGGRDIKVESLAILVPTKRINSAYDRI